MQAVFSLILVRKLEADHCTGFLRFLIAEQIAGDRGHDLHLGRWRDPPCKLDIDRTHQIRVDCLAINQSPVKTTSNNRK